MDWERRAEMKIIMVVGYDFQRPLLLLKPVVPTIPSSNFWEEDLEKLLAG